MDSLELLEIGTIVKQEDGISGAKSSCVALAVVVGGALEWVSSRKSIGSA